jgi:hypothetical protein
LRKQGFGCTLPNGEVIIIKIKNKNMTKVISIGHILTRDAMKNLKGGIAYDVNCTAAPGYTQQSPGSCTGTVSACQSLADSWCSQTANHCLSCTIG